MRPGAHLVAQPAVALYPFLSLSVLCRRLGVPRARVTRYRLIVRALRLPSRRVFWGFIRERGAARRAPRGARALCLVSLRPGALAGRGARARARIAPSPRSPSRESCAAVRCPISFIWPDYLSIWPLALCVALRLRGDTHTRPGPRGESGLRTHPAESRQRQRHTTSQNSRETRVQLIIVHFIAVL